MDHRIDVIKSFVSATYNSNMQRGLYVMHIRLRYSYLELKLKFNPKPALINNWIQCIQEYSAQDGRTGISVERSIYLACGPVITKTLVSTWLVFKF